MNNIPDKYLPIGTIIKLKNGKRRIMIIGFIPPETDDNDKILKLKDYIGCPFPIGLYDIKQLFAFNHEDIDEIFALGFATEKHQELSDNLCKLTSNGTIDKIIKQFNDMEKKADTNE